jgi:PIN domain nuclease of toxin-antitoxin system
VKYLLDTGVFLLALSAPDKLNRHARELVSGERSGMFLSAASSWEIAVKYALRKLDLPEPPARYVPTRMFKWGIQPLEITHSHALSAGELPAYHQDPFDRMLIAQAIAEQMTLATSDQLFERYDVKLFWCGR